MISFMLTKSVVKIHENFSVFFFYFIFQEEREKEREKRNQEMFEEKKLSQIKIELKPEEESCEQRETTAPGPKY